MTPEDRLEEVFERGFDEGLDSLNPNDRQLFLIWEFILDQEMGGLSGYFYNHLPDLAHIHATVEAMRHHRLVELAALLTRALELFADYVDPDSASTWNEVLARYDPEKRLGAIGDEINALDNYGLAQSTIA